MNTYVFFHVGDDCLYPQLLVHSINACDPGAEVIQVSNEGTPNISGVTRRHNIQGDPMQLMSMRLKGFAELRLDYPAIYLDTDMILIRPCSPRLIIGDMKIMMCRRSFNRDATFNESFRGMNLSEYSGRKLDDVYPYLACATITANFEVWQSLSAVLKGLDPKYRLWYGDQEALKIYKKKRPSVCGAILENIYGCLPEHYSDYPAARIVHFKGAERKSHMPHFFSSRYAAS